MPQARFKLLFLSALTGLLAGIAAAIFLILLNFATNYRDENSALIWLLPLAGFVIGWAYFRFGKDIASGNNLILDEIHNPQKVTPLHMVPFILIGTVITHFFGGSAGREGTVVQMGGSLSDQLTKFFNISSEQRKTLLMAGMGAGFGAAIGAPWAGAIFGVEVVQAGRLRWRALPECFIASMFAYWTTIRMQAPHSSYPKLEVSSYAISTFLWILLAGIAFGICARVFIWLTHCVERAQMKWISYPPLKPALGGLILVILFYLEGSYRYVGLGIPAIQQSLTQGSYALLDPLYKAIFTAITVGSGFKGGEFIPLVFMGTTLGAGLAILIPVSFQLLASLGFAAVFAGAANTPLACTIMAVEIFGAPITPYALLACLMSYYFSGKKSIYSSQKISKLR